MATDANGNQIFGRYSVGVHNVGSYQVSGWPWITGSLCVATDEHWIRFPKVAKSVTVILSGSGDGSDVASTRGHCMRVHFNSTASGDVVAGKHYVTLDGTEEESVTFDVKCKEIFVSSVGSTFGYELIAELTNIPTASMGPMTGSGLTMTGSSGIHRWK